MAPNLFDYIISDLYYHLVMSFNGPGKGYPVTRNTVVNRNDYDPDVMNRIRAKGLEGYVPDAVHANNYNHIMDSHGRFHTENPDNSSLHCGTMLLYWFEGLPEFSGTVGREFGPAKVSMSRLSQWHREGLLHRHRDPAVTCQCLRVEWINNQIWQRESGPEVIEFHEVQLYALSGEIHGVQVGRICYDWTIDGVKLNREAVEKVITKFGFKLNILSPDSVFANETDEFNFYNELVTEGG